MTEKWIASAELIVVSPKGHEIPVSVGIGRPYRAEGGVWRCPARLTGLHDRLADMAGEDSLQALCMAASLIRQLLGVVKEDGGQILYADGRSDYPLNAVFGGIGEARPTNGV